MVEDFVGGLVIAWLALGLVGLTAAVFGATLPAWLLPLSWLPVACLAGLIVLLWVLG